MTKIHCQKRSFKCPHCTGVSSVWIPMVTPNKDEIFIYPVCVHCKSDEPLMDMIEAKEVYEKHFINEDPVK